MGAWGKAESLFDQSVTRETVQSENCLSCKHRDQNSISGAYMKKPGTPL